MAKLKAPLFSLGASGQLGKALVYFGWKGLDVVREYVIPAYSDTIPQQTQRDYLRKAVAQIHLSMALALHPILVADTSAYALWASVVQAATTWFNQACKQWMKVKVASKWPIIYSDGITTATVATGAKVSIHIEGEGQLKLAACKFFLGSTKTALLNSKVAAAGAGGQLHNNAAPWTTLTAGKKYFWQLRPDTNDPCEGSWSGIYHFTAT